MKIAPLLLLSLSTLPLVAQQPVLVRATDPLVLRLQGPERLRASFLATNVGTLLEAKEAGSFWTLLKGVFRDRLRGIGRGAGGQLATLVDALKGYGGEITIAADLTPHPEAWAGIRPDLGGVIVFAPDGRTDLDTIARDVREGLRGSRFEIEDFQVGDTTLPLVMTSKRSGVVLPTRIGEDLVVFFGEDVRGVVESRLTGDADPFVFDGELAGAPIAFRVDLERLVALEAQDPSYQLSSVSPEDFGKASGLGSLRELRITVRPRGPYVAIESSVRFAPDVWRGFFEGFMPAVQGAPGMIGMIPPGTPYWQAGKMRVDHLVRATIESIAAWSKAADVPLEEAVEGIREQAKAFAGVDLETEVFAHLDGEVAIVGSLFGGPDGEDEVDIDPSQVGAATGTVLFAFGLRDRAAFEKGWDDLTRNGDFFFGDEEEYEHAGVEMHATSHMAWAIADEAYLVAFGDTAEDWMQAVLDHRRATLVDGQLPTALPRDVERRMRHAPAGFQGCGAFDVRSLIGVPVFELLDMDDELGDLVGTGWAKVFESLRPFLEQHGLARATGYAGWADDRWSYRVLW